jgi:D-beta-D-heptose 7-phosphate kinase/D-beta-D-heptose 1-phosphate adenosyltransferase
MRQIRVTNRIIVAVSGGFDPLHVGHVRYFREAKKLGNYLVVLLNSDRFLREKKGYVVMPFEERREILEALKPVDEVVAVIDTDDTVARTLEAVKPSVFAKGGDRTRKNMPPAEVEVCQRLGIRMVFGVGGGKIRSSSWLIPKSVKR